MVNMTSGESLPGGFSEDAGSCPRPRREAVGLAQHMGRAAVAIGHFRYLLCLVLFQSIEE